MSERVAVRIEPWGADDLALLEKLMGDPAMMAHLGGPESREQILDRQQRYAAATDPRETQMYKIVSAATGEGVGSVGYWEREWQGEQVYEIGWSVLPAFQGRGIAAAAATLTIEQVRRVGKHRSLHAFPGVDNPPSNALCRKLGFTLLGTSAFEYPPGHSIRCNDWRLDLSTDASARRGETP